MKNVLAKVWLRLVIVLLMVSLLVVGMVTRCYNTRNTLPEGKLPQAVQESAAAYIAEFTMLLDTYLPEHYLADE